MTEKRVAERIRLCGSIPVGRPKAYSSERIKPPQFNVKRKKRNGTATRRPQRGKM